jgi:Fe-S cluster assembly protein SufD
VTNADCLPTRKSEAFRYADLDALAQVWPLPEAGNPRGRGAGGSFARTIDAARGRTRGWRIALEGRQGRSARAQRRAMPMAGWR